MKRIALACAVCTASALFAAPVARMEPVAAGFPAWQGVTPKNHVLGREITPGDLRHRVAVVVEVEPGANLRAQLLKAAGHGFRRGREVAPVLRNRRPVALPGAREGDRQGEAASIVKELQKMKVSLANLKESKVIAVQNGAQVIDAQIDELVSTIPDRVAGK